jgi:predicted RNA-binding Zn ribbon-like protein
MYGGSVSRPTDSSPEQFRIVGGHPALDLVNTVTPRIPGGLDGHDYLSGPSELLAWSRRTGIVTEPEIDAITAAWRRTPGLADSVLGATVEIREATYSVLAARLADSQAPRASAFEQLMLRWAAAAARSALVPTVDGIAELVVGTAPARMIPDRLVAAAVELLRTADLRQLRACPIDEGGCGWLFLDRSRNGSRRWCAMEDCGTQAKIRKMSERRRATTV